MTESAFEHSMPSTQGESPATDGPKTLGARLRCEREQAGLTQEQVATQLNLALRQVQALEGDNFGALPGVASVRGFVRAYAKLLKLAPDDLVAMIPLEKLPQAQQLEPRLMSSKTMPGSRMPNPGRTGRPSPMMAFGLFMLVVVAGVIVAQRVGLLSSMSDFRFGRGAEKQAVAGSDPAAASGSSASTNDMASTATAANSTSEVLKPQIQTPASDAVVAPASTNATTADGGSGAVATPAVSSSATPPVVPVTNATSGMQSQPALQAQTNGTGADTATGGSHNDVVASEGNTLVLTANGDSWVEVKGARSVVFSKMLHKGDHEVVSIKEAAALTVGNAAAVEVKFKGETLEVKPGAKSNVFRYNLK